MKIKINEIFASIDGEVTHWGQGGLTTFIRLAGCNLRCSYCDTEYAQDNENSKSMDIKRILDKIETQRVTITGGEPLLQSGALRNLLVPALIRRGVHITIETNGTFPLFWELLDVERKFICWVIDYKFEFADQMQINNFIKATEQDCIKFVVDKEEDYQTALKQIDRFKKYTDAKMTIGTTQREVSYKDLIDNLIKDKQWDVSLNVQLHKFINVK
jgi:7-carboxy-7-deazaguanine synthase